MWRTEGRRGGGDDLRTTHGGPRLLDGSGSWEAWRWGWDLQTDIRFHRYLALQVVLLVYNCVSCVRVALWSHRSQAGASCCEPG